MDNNRVNPINEMRPSAVESKQPPPYATRVAYVTQTPPSDEYVQDHCGWSCFTCLCCCCIFGLVGLYYSSEVQHYKEIGNNEKAKAYSEKAQRVNMIGCIIGLIASIVTTILYFTI